MPKNVTQLRHARRRKRQREKRKKYEELPLYRDVTLPNNPTRRIKDPTPYFAFRKK
jgi:hypothetical protein